MEKRHGDLYELHVIRRPAVLILKHLKYVHALKRRGQLDLDGRSVIDSRLQFFQGRASVQQGLKALRKIQQCPRPVICDFRYEDLEDLEVRECGRQDGQEGADGVFDTSGEERRDVADAHSTEGVFIVIARGGPNS